MYVLETKHLPLKGYMVINNKECVIQELSEDDSILVERLVPVLHQDEKVQEIALTIDDMVCKIFKSFSIINIYPEYIDTGEYRYVFESSDVLTWGTRLPELKAIMKVPMCTLDGQCDVKIKNDYIILNDTLYIKIFKKFSDFEKGISVDINIMRDIWSKHKDEYFKLYLEEEFPICIEFLEPKVRYYVAPIDI